MKLSNKIKIYENYLFLGILSIIFIFGAFTFIKNERKSSTTENRSLNTFEHFTIKDFIKGTFQDNFEEAISDQLPLSGTIRTAYGQMVTSLPTFGIDNIVCQNHYMAIPGDTSNKYRTFNCEDYILRTPSKLADYQQKNLAQNIKNLNQLNNKTETYYYIINTSSTYDFEKNQKVIDYKDVLSKNLTNYHDMISLNCDDYETYKKFFYKTDLHWNYLGSYQGFIDIAKMLGIKNPATPTGTFSHHEDTFGSYARSVQKYDWPEDFTIYTFNIPKHDTTINGVKKEYNHIQEYINHNYEYGNFDYYAYTYGINYGEIIFDFHQKSKENLLIIADSFSNPINELIAQYFNKTYVIDLRYYKNEIGKDFSLTEYLKDKNIDKTLLIISSEFFITKDGTTDGLEK